MRITSLVLLYVSVNSGIANYFFNKWQFKTLQVSDISEPYDIGILLGPFIWQGLVYTNGQEITTFEHTRFHDAIQIYKQGKFKKFLISGYNIPELTKAYLVNLGIPSEDILVEGLSKNTYENALLSKQFLVDNKLSTKRLLLITSASHMRRAIKCFDKVGLNVTPLSVDIKTTDHSFNTSIWILPNSNALNKWKALFQEWAGMLHLYTISI